MLNRSTSLAMSTSVLKALPGKLDIKRHSPSTLYVDAIEINHLTLIGATRAEHSLFYNTIQVNIFSIKICNYVCTVESCPQD